MVADAADPLRARLRDDIKAAMRARDGNETRLLRALLAAIDNAQAVPVAQAAQVARVDRMSPELPRVALTSADLHALLSDEMAERSSAAEAMAGHGHGERAARLHAEVAIIGRYLAG